MKVLAFDTALDACSVALLDGATVLAVEQRIVGRGQAELLLPMINMALQQGGLTFAALDRVAVTTGPGTFTGIRTGLATARGLALVTGCPVIGLTTLEVLAASAGRSDRPLLAVIDARRGQVYAQFFDADLRPVGAPLAGSVDMAAALLPASAVRLIGSGAALVQAARRDSHDEVLDLPTDPDPVVLARLAQDAAIGIAPVPLYLRPPNVTLPAQRPSVRP